MIQTKKLRIKKKHKLRKIQSKHPTKKHKLRKIQSKHPTKKHKLRKIQSKHSIMKKKAAAPEKPYTQTGNLNQFWVKNIEPPFSRVSYVVDPDSGTYCHSTFKAPGDKISYHYGFEANSNLQKGLHHWTTPYNSDYPEVLRKYLENLYNTHC